MMNSHFKPPAHFSPGPHENIAQAWQASEEQFKLYLVASREDVAEGEVQVAMRCAIGPKYSKIFSKFNLTMLTVTQQKDLDLVLKAYKTYFEPKKLIKSYVTRFQQRHQGPHESLSDYIASVRELASHCEFGALIEESQVAIQISNGVHDVKLKEKLWDDDLSLEQIIQKCNTFEQCMETRKLPMMVPFLLHFTFHYTGISKKFGGKY
jgi:hypothetical protein